MRIPTYQEFMQSIEIIAHREVDGFVRYWGVLVAPGERTIAFWRHEPGVFHFKVGESYAAPHTPTSKISEKLGRGYEEVSVKLLLVLGGILPDIYSQYVDALKDNSFE